MKKMKKIASFLLALVMVFSMTTTAFAAKEVRAAANGTITINNATKDTDYTVYKVFDLTTDGTAVAYTFTKTVDTEAFFQALQEPDSPFTLTASASNPEVFNVSVKEGQTGDTINTFLKKNVAKLTEKQTQKATGTTVTFSELEYGYYYVTSSLGAVASIDSVKPDAVIIDKNQKPGWDPENPSTPDESTGTGKFVSDRQDGKYGKESSSQIDGTAWFKINAFAPKYAGDKMVAEYIFTDTLGDGFTYNNDLKVMLGDKELTKEDDYTVAVVGQEIKVTVKAGTIAEYPSDAHLSILYSAKVDKDATYDNVNKVTMSWTVYPNDANDKPQTDQPPQPPTDPEDPKNPDPSETHTYVFGFNLQKYKEQATPGNELDGAEFKLYDQETGGQPIKFVETKSGEYRVADATDVDTVEVIKAGTAKIFGLKEQNYYLEETVAPDGYNILDKRVLVTISKGSASVEGILNEVIPVINKAGTVLPSTGGMGTTLFYMLGGILVLGSLVVLISKRRMNK